MTSRRAVGRVVLHDEGKTMNFIQRNRVLTAVVLIAIVMALGAMLAGCGPTHGRIYARYYYEESYYIDWICMSYNKYNQCTFKSSVTRIIPERFSFGLENEEERGQTDVSSVDYHRYNVGDYYGEVPED